MSTTRVCDLQQLAKSPQAPQLNVQASKALTPKYAQVLKLNAQGAPQSRVSWPSQWTKRGWGHRRVGGKKSEEQTCSDFTIPHPESSHPPQQTSGTAGLWLLDK